MYGRSALLQCTENIISETNVAKSPASRCIVKDAIQVLQFHYTIIEELWQLFHIVYHDELHKLMISKDILVIEWTSYKDFILHLLIITHTQ